MHALSETWNLKNSTTSSPICSVQPQKWATKSSHEGERQQYTQYTFHHCLPALVLSRMYTSTYRTAVLIHYSFENYYVFVLPGELSKWIGKKKKKNLNGVRTHNLCDTGAVLYQLSYQANRELVTLWVRNIPVEGDYENEYTKECLNFFQALISQLLKLCA